MTNTCVATALAREWWNPAVARQSWKPRTVLTLPTMFHFHISYTSPALSFLFIQPMAPISNINVGYMVRFFVFVDVYSRVDVHCLL
jgi:hypothetical protein